MKHTVLAGGVGAARYLKGAIEAFEATSVCAVVNVADDFTLHGLRICPDLDTCTYTLANQVHPERGWGLAHETLGAMKMLERYGGASWFSLSDQDLGTHLYRTQRLGEGATLTQTTAEIAKAWGIEARLLPATDDPLQTFVTLANDKEVAFQEYFVKLGHQVAISSVRFEGASLAAPSAHVLAAIAEADALVIAPSNPVVSIDPILAISDIASVVRKRREKNVAVSPLVGGEALKGPAAQMMKELGEPADVVGIARRYRDYCATLVVDSVDAELVDKVEAEGMRAVAMPTIMSEPGVACALAKACHELGSHN